MAYNTRLYISAGLLNDYNVFNLNKAYIDNIGVSIITDGNQYIENSETNIMHAGNSNFKEFEGISPSNVTSPEHFNNLISLYGDKIRESLEKYFPNLPLSVEGKEELWNSNEAYKKYNDLFKITFKDTTSGTISDRNDEYYTYERKTESIKTHTYISKVLSDVDGENGNYVYLNAQIIHYSKYYNIYDSNNLSIPILLPMIYTGEDLEKYNLKVAGNIMYVKSITKFTAWGDNVDTKDFRRELRYDIDNDNTFQVLPNSNMKLGHDSSHKWWWSQFKNHPSGRHHVSEVDSDIPYESYYPQGFTIFGFKNEANDWVLDPYNTGTSKYENLLVPSTWLLYFPSNHNNKYNYTLHHYGRVDMCTLNTPPLCSLLFRGDSNDNVHMLNCWFTLKTSGAFGGGSLDRDTWFKPNQVYQEIAYKSNNINKCRYIGLWIASVFCNIYHYVDNSTEPISNIIDTIYYNPYYTTFTKDIIYILLANLPSNNDFKGDNLLILFNKVPFLDYVNKVKLKAGAVSGSTVNINYTSTESNITINLKSCIKNVPLLYRLKYIEPDINFVNRLDNLVILKSLVDSDKKYYVNFTPEYNKLYLLLEEDGKLYITELNSQFKIRYFNEVSLNNGILSGKYMNNVGPEKNPSIVDTWEYNDGLRLTDNTGTNNIANYYGLYNENDSRNLLYGDLSKKEILIPFAAFV